MDYYNNEDNNSLNKKTTNDVSYIWGNELNYVTPIGNQVKNKKQLFRRFAVWGIVAFFVLLVCVSIILSQLLGRGWLGNRIFKSNNNISITIPTLEKPTFEKQYFNEETGEYTAEGIAKAVMPSVVSIEIFEKGVAFLPSSQGSGIILTENGYVITNAHVIENATRGIKVILNNEDEYEAEIVGSDTKTDLAVLKINAEGLTPAEFGDSDQLNVGEDIIALGSPAGLFGSLSKGVVSGLNRMINTEATNLKMNCIQIDAPINPGNSGGALVNMFGQVVGINSSKYMEDNYEGLGFAISINEARPILEAIIEDGYVKGRVKIGILFYEISEKMARENDAKAGLFIEEIDPECDVANSGLQPNDIITHVNGELVYSREDIMKVIEGKKPGDEISATVYREDLLGKYTTFEITFKLMEDITMVIPNSESN